MPIPVALSLALLAAALVHSSAVGTWFAQDDVTFLLRARGALPTPWSLSRPLSEGVLWRTLYAAFGLHPLPYHFVLLALHLANVALVFAIGRRMLRGTGPALAAAVLFGASPVAFTPLHWISGLVELTVTTFALAALLAHLEARARGGTFGLWLSALLGLAALLCKESALLFPVPLLVADRRLAWPNSRPKAPWPAIVVAAIYGIGFLASLRLIHYVGSLAYSMTPSPAHLLTNLATYLRWLVSPWAGVPDAVAAADPRAVPSGLGLALAIGLAMWLQRRDREHPAEVGLAWFLAFLAPVLPLAHHTYLYYLYLPLPGLTWLIAAIGARFVARHGSRWAMAAAAACAAWIWVGHVGVHDREHARVGDFAADKTIRESTLLRNAIASLDSAGLVAGDEVAFVNPAPVRHTDLAASARDAGIAAGDEQAYVPLQGALRGGEAIELFLPGVRGLGFGRDVPPRWEKARIFLFQDDGHLRSLGRGGAAHAELGYFRLKLRQFDEADADFRRSLALGDTLADAVFGLVITSSFAERADEAKRWATEFLRRWPDEPRAPVVRQGMASPAAAPPP